MIKLNINSDQMNSRDKYDLLIIAIFGVGTYCIFYYKVIPIIIDDTFRMIHLGCISQVGYNGVHLLHQLLRYIESYFMLTIIFIMHI